MRFSKKMTVSVALLGLMVVAGCATKKCDNSALEAAASRAEAAASKADAAAKSAGASADRAAAAADRAEALFKKTTHK